MPRSRPVPSGTLRSAGFVLCVLMGVTLVGATPGQGAAPAGSGQRKRGPVRARPFRKAGVTVLFQASPATGQLFAHYTARWQAGSDFTPVAAVVEKGNSVYLEIAYRGRRGMACSTLWVEKLPATEAGRRYCGVRLVIDCDGDEYARLGVRVHFRDQTQISDQLTLEKGEHAYDVTRGFRRAKTPPDWSLVDYVMLTAETGRFGRYDARHLRFRLRRIEMLEEAVTASEPVAPVTHRLGDRVFVPQPKQVRWLPGQLRLADLQTIWLAADASARTRRTAELLADLLYGFTGRRFAVQTRAGGWSLEAPPVGVELRVARSATFDGRPVKARPQGYVLTVGQRGVRIVGFEEPGLFYGTVTLRQLLQQPMRVVEGRPVPCVQILDWPDLPFRLCRLEHVHAFKGWEVKENRGVEYLMDWVDRFVAGAKLNVLMIDLSAVVRYQRRPEFNGRERMYSLDDLRRFGDFCRDRFVQLCPAWQCGGHANWWLTIGYHPELREKGWADQADVTHPDHDPIVFDCMQDVVDALRPAFVSPKSDEWWHKRKADETPEPLLHGKTRAEAFRDFHLKLCQRLKPQGVTLCLFHDMLTPFHNGTRFDVYKVLDDLPRDVVILVWSDRHPKMIRYFTDRGFRAWGNPTGEFFPDNADRERLEGFGKGLYSFGFWPRNLLDQFSPLYSMPTLLRAADFAWNARQDDGSSTQAQLRSGRLVVASGIFATRPNPTASPNVVPLDLTGVFNASLAAVLASGSGRQRASGRPREASGADAAGPAVRLPAGVLPIGFVPARLAGDRPRNCVAVGEGEPPVRIRVERRCSSLVFLHAARIDNPDDPRATGAAFRRWPYGWPLGEYEVVYADGRSLRVPIRIGSNVKRFNTSPLNRTALDVRCTWPVPLSSPADSLDKARRSDGGSSPGAGRAREQDDGQFRCYFFQWEWVNPRPDVSVAEVVVHHSNQLSATLVLLALSAREPNTTTRAGTSRTGRGQGERLGAHEGGRASLEPASAL